MCSNWFPRYDQVFSHVQTSKYALLHFLKLVVIDLVSFKLDVSHDSMDRLHS